MNRVGIGIDVHRFAPGRKCIIGGVHIPHPVGLLGQPVNLVETPFLNLKVTTPADLATVEALLRARR